MKPQDRMHELEAALTKISTFRTSSATSIVLMFIGVAIIIGALVFSIFRLGPLEKQADELTTRTEELTRQSDELREELMTTQQKLDSIMKQAEKVRFGVMATQARDYIGAIAAFDEVIALDPNNANVYNYKGYAQYRLPQYAKAIETLKTCSQVDPANVWCHYNLALAYWQTGNKDLAVAEVRQSVDLDPGFREIFKGDVQFTKFKSSAEYRQLINGGYQSK